MYSYQEGVSKMTQKLWKLQNQFDGKYTRVASHSNEQYDELCDGDREDEVKFARIRLADHSMNRANNSRYGFDGEPTLSYLITDENATANRGYGFDSSLEWDITDLTEDEALAFIREKVKEKLGWENVWYNNFEWKL